MTSLDGHTEVSWAVPEAQRPVEEAGLVQRNLAAFVMSSGLEWALKVRHMFSYILMSKQTPM